MFDENAVNGLDLPADYQLQASGSAGLEPLAAVNAPAQPAMPPSFAQAAPAVQETPPLGLAQPAGQQLPNEDQQFLESLPTHQRIGLALQAFSAGVRGGESPINALLQQRRQQKIDFQHQMEKSAALTKEGMDVIRNFPEGSDGRKAAIEMYRRAAGPLGNEVAAALSSVGKADQQAFDDLVGAAQLSAGREALWHLSGGNIDKARKVMQDKEGQALIFKAADAVTLPGLIQKVQVISKALEQNPNWGQKGPDGKPVFSMADVDKYNSQLPPEFKLTPAEISTARRNQEALVPFGLKTDKMVEREQMASERGAEWDRRQAQRVEDRPIKADISHGAKSLTPEQNAALFGPDGAVTTGRLDPGKINSRTASIFADAELSNPGTDFAKTSGDINLGRNATFRQKAMIAEALPETLKKLVEAGSDMNYSKVQFIAKMQEFAAGQTSDPKFIRLMAIRNDALANLSGVMRSVGMSDYMHKQEISASPSTMPPDSFVAWYKAQMDVLGPRIKEYKKITKSDLGQGDKSANKPTSTSEFSTEAEAEAAAKAGKLKSGTRVTIGGKTGTWH